MLRSGVIWNREFVWAVIIMLASWISAGIVGWKHADDFAEAYRELVNVTLKLWYAHGYPIVEAVRKARQGPPTRKADDRVILVPDVAGPVVESRDTKYPVPLAHVPIRSSKADGKRLAHAYAERRTGQTLTWKRARQLMNKWEREEREEHFRELLSRRSV